MKRFRILALAVLSLSIVICTDLAVNYFGALVPEMNDGLTLRGILTPLFFGDDGWTLAGFYEGFVLSLRITVLLAVGNILLACIDIKNTIK